MIQSSAELVSSPEHIESRLDDHRLGELEAALRAPGVAVLSLDCFDTLLWRTVPKPVDAFTLLGEELVAAGALAGGINPATFARLRISAEALARHRKRELHGSSEVTLADIYAEFDPKLTTLTHEELRRTELALERRITVVDHGLAQTLSELVAELSLRAVFVSDMYLTGAEISDLINRPEMADLAEIEVISSADVGVSKETGLWHSLPAQWGVAPAQVVHVGNNAVADFAAPRAAGVTALHWAELPARLAAIVAAEGCHPGAHAKLRVRSADDRGVVTLRGRAAFAAAAAQHENEVAWQTGTSVLGPVMSGYADWVQRRTAELGINHALCVMREGRFLKETIESAAPSRRNPLLRCELLWASRAAIARANIKYANVAEMTSMFSRLRIPSVAEAARTLGIDLTSVPGGSELAAGAAQQAGDPAALERFLRLVLSQPALVAEIRELAARRRENFVAHLRSALDGATGDVAYVDVGFSGANQEKLQALIDAEGLGVRLHGLYLMADPCPEDRVLRGNIIEGFLGSPGDPRPVNSIALDRNRLLLELLLLSEDGSTLEIDDAGRPVFAAQVEPEHQMVARRAVHDGIRAYQRHVNRYRLTEQGEPLASLDGTVGRRIVERFLVEPTRDEAAVFGHWMAEDDYNSLEPTPIVPTTPDRVLRRLTGRQLADAPSERVLWPAGANALWTDPLTASAGFDLSQAGAMRVEWQTRVGAQNGTMVPVKLARDGALVGAISADAAHLTGVTIFPVLVDGLLRLDSLQVTLKSRSSGWRSTLWSWTAGDAPETLMLANCGWIAADILNVGPESALIVTLPEPLGPDAFVELELQGGFLPGVDNTPTIGMTPTGPSIFCPPAV